MKLGIIASYQEEKTFETVKNLGLDGIEFTVNFNKDSKQFLEDIPEIARRMEKIRSYNAFDRPLGHEARR